MNRLALLFLLVVTTAAFAQAPTPQSPTRVRGTITSLDGDVLSVKSRDGSDVKVHLTSDAGVATAKSTTLAELKGKPVGVTAMSKEGKMVAVEGHALPPTVPQGHTPWDLPGEFIFTTARNEGGKLVTQRVSVSKDGINPPQ